MSLKLIEIFTDGACKGNPGPGGWGVILRYQQTVKKLYGAEKDTTNNRMELTAVIQGLNALKSSCKVVVYTDSKYVYNGMLTWVRRWEKNGWKNSKKEPVKNVDLWQNLDRIAHQHKVRWVWVKGHAGHPENEEADALANQAIIEFLT